MDLIALRDEIVADPESVGYKEGGGDWKGDQVIAALLNDPANGEVITRKRIQPSELQASFDLTEYVALDQAQRDYLASLMTDVIDATEPPVLAALQSIFPSGTTTRTALLLKIQRQGSRAEVLWGEGVVVTASDVGHAANEVI